MKIYTKQGDHGETGLWGGARVAKDDLRIRAYGTLDELNSMLGLAQVSLLRSPAIEPLAQQYVHKALLRIQNELFQLGAELATPKEKKVGIALVGEEAITRLESEIDTMESHLPPLKTFILPGGTETAAELHLARTICRRAEREMVTLHRTESLRLQTLQFVNRLSDALFVIARYCNFKAGQEDLPWIAPTNESQT